MFSTSESQRTWTSVKSSEAISGKFGPKDCRSQRKAKVDWRKGSVFLAQVKACAKALEWGRARYILGVERGSLL